LGKLTERFWEVKAMVAQLTLREVLERGIRKEIESQRLYIALSQMVKDEAARDALQKLSRQEKGHQKRLEQYLWGELKGGALSSGHSVDYKIAELLGEPDVSPHMELKDTFLLAANREKASHEFYLSLARIHPEGEVKKLLERLAAQELEHKQKVESLYTEVAFPQTDGG
jgi:rubrerythrin